MQVSSALRRHGAARHGGDFERQGEPVNADSGKEAQAALY